MAGIIDFGLHHRPADPTERIRNALELHGRISERVTDIPVPIDVWLRCARAAAAELGRTVDARDAGRWVWAELGWVERQAGLTWGKFRSALVA